MTATFHPTTAQNAHLLGAHALVGQLLATRPQLGVASAVTITTHIGVRVQISSEDTRNPATVLLAWAALLGNPTVTGIRRDPMFTFVHVHGTYADEPFTVTASFGENEAADLVRDACGELTVHDLQRLQAAGVR
ncbi:hypothetical protein [Actinocrispum wychmicini]|uniref:Uncharacterized protein n=1 Tax=Actinocrispum wychmicini TaxID=1213861 RepID=A0A4R2JG03_9PSEU|nr:hypothetical protein [Actinocrispum wychmicini]TCO57192.1 hypothetical protein EV192_106669 [Actinocrispum wychmicini]